MGDSLIIYCVAGSRGNPGPAGIGIGIYAADFVDYANILEKNKVLFRDHFKDIGRWKSALGRLVKVRNSIAHGRNYVLAKNHFNELEELCVDLQRIIDAEPRCHSGSLETES